MALFIVERATGHNCILKGLADAGFVFGIGNPAMSLTHDALLAGDGEGLFHKAVLEVVPGMPLVFTM